MAKTIKPSELDKALEEQLGIYHADVLEGINEAAANAVKKLVKLTKANAPKGARGSFKKSITSKLLEKNARGCKHLWYVKGPDARLTHLLVHGHATKDGGRTKADPFLENALDVVLPEYEEQVKEAIKK
jgi:hypothetical protein